MLPLQSPFIQIYNDTHTQQSAEATAKVSKDIFSFTAPLRPDQLYSVRCCAQGGFEKNAIAKKKKKKKAHFSRFFCELGLIWNGHFQQQILCSGSVPSDGPVASNISIGETVVRQRVPPLGNTATRAALQPGEKCSQLGDHILQSQGGKQSGKVTARPDLTYLPEPLRRSDGRVQLTMKIYQYGFYSFSKRLKTHWTDEDALFHRSGFLTQSEPPPPAHRASTPCWFLIARQFAKEMVQLLPCE